MIEVFLGTFLGILLGVASSMLSWFILFHVIVPKIRFSNFISRTAKPDSAGCHRYWLKFENYGRRGIVDVEFICQLRIKGLRPREKTSWRLFYPKIQYRRLPFFPSILKGGLRQLIEIIPVFEDLDSERSLPNNLREIYAKGNLLLEDLLSAGDKAELRIFTYGYDSFSGTRKAFQSPAYNLECIQPFAYELNSLALNPDSGPKPTEPEEHCSSKIDKLIKSNEVGK